MPGFLLYGHDDRGGAVLREKKQMKWLPFCLGLLLLAALIQGLGALKGDRLVFPDVPSILRAFFALLRQPETFLRLRTTLGHLLISLAFSTVLGILLGLLEGLSGFCRQLLRPVMIFLRALPMIVLVIIAMVLLPYRLVPVVGTCCVLVPLISEAAAEGCRRIDRELIDVYRLNSDLNPSILRHVYLPLMGGYLRQAYENAVGMGIKVTVTTEYLVQAAHSLGKAVYSTVYFNEYADLYAFALLMILLVLALSALPRALTAVLNRRAS